MSLNRNKSVSPDKFYGPPTPLQIRIEAAIKKESKTNSEQIPKVCRSSLLGPSRTWLVFKKQKDAIECCLKRRNGLMCFAFEKDNDGNRLFMVAHPKVFWNFDSQRPYNKRRSYEVIQEYSVCKLYFDIEFECEYNGSLIGNKMLDNFLSIVNYNLRALFNVNCGRDRILDLDSSTPEKYSHHIIYQMENAAFQNNYAIGNFVKSICDDFKEAHKKSILGDHCQLEELSKKYSVPVDNILEFFVKDRKGQTKLFIDEGVYTKNRHFRILGSSKASKNIPLVVSENNLYISKGNSNNQDCNLFLDSLITYFHSDVTKILNFEGKNVKTKSNLKSDSVKIICDENISSAHPEVDSFIKSLICHEKGTIRRVISFSTSAKVVYEILGYRYCHNIQRQHKRNNIKLIVDLNELVYYQKCYDPDCSDFRSANFPLPCEIRFLYEDNSLFENDSVLNSDFYDNDDEFLKAVEKIDTENKFPSGGLSDTDFDEVVNCVEGVYDVL